MKQDAAINAQDAVTKRRQSYKKTRSGGGDSRGAAEPGAEPSRPVGVLCRLAC